METTAEEREEQEKQEEEHEEERGALGVGMSVGTSCPSRICRSLTFLQPVL